MKRCRTGACAAVMGSSASVRAPLRRWTVWRSAGAGLACALAMAMSAVPAPASAEAHAGSTRLSDEAWQPSGATPAPPLAQASAPGLDEVLRLLSERRHGHATFTEVQTLAILDRPLESSGELLYDAPDRLEKRTLRPKPETLLLDHGVLTARRGHRTWTMSLRNFPEAVPLVESIRATLAGDATALERFFSLGFSGTVEHWSLTLVPNDKTVARFVKEIRIEGERGVIRTVRLTQNDGDASLMTIGPELAP